jgi:hypothetical protein
MDDIITKIANRQRIVAECTATLEGEYNERLKIFTDGSLKDERVGYAIVNHDKKNRMRSQIKAIYIYLKAKELL